MAFGDAVQQSSGNDTDLISLAANAQSGNSIVFLAYFRTFEGGYPLGASDETRSEQYTEVFNVGDYNAGDAAISLFFLPDVSAGAVTVSVDGSSPYRWILAEIEGVLSPTGQSGEGSSQVISSSVTTTSATAADESVSIGGVVAVGSAGFTPSDPLWSELGRNAHLTALIRNDASSLSIDLNGTLELDRKYAAGFAVFQEAAASTAPKITDINTNNEVTPGEASSLTGSNLSNATGLKIGSVSQTGFTVVDENTVTFTCVRGSNPYNQDLTATLLSPDGNDTVTVQQVPEVETFAVTAASPNTTDDASLWTGLIDTSTGDPVTVVDGDQALVTDPNSLGNLAVTPAGEISADTEGNFVVQFWRASEGAWGSDQTVTFEVPIEAEDNWPFGKGITPSIPVTWTWGRRHPKTGMRVRIFK